MRNVVCHIFFLLTCAASDCASLWTRNRVPFDGIIPLGESAVKRSAGMVQGTPACKSIGGLLCLAIPLGVCDAESDHVTLSQWLQPLEPDLGNASVGKRQSPCTDVQPEPYST